jgi:hypothetical protein
MLKSADPREPERQRSNARRRGSVKGKRLARFEGNAEVQWSVEMEELC